MANYGYGSALPDDEPQEPGKKVIPGRISALQSQLDQVSSQVDETCPTCSRPLGQSQNQGSTQGDKKEEEDKPKPDEEYLPPSNDPMVNAFREAGRAIKEIAKAAETKGKSSGKEE